MTQYELWSVLGQWAGAIATTLAVIVALWTARLPYSKKLRVDCSTAFYVGVPDENYYYIVSAINVGQRDVKISMIGLWIENKQFFIPSTIGECQRIIKTAESVSHQISFNYIRETLRSKKFKANSKIYAFARDEEGMQKKIYLNKKVKDIM